MSSMVPLVPATLELADNGTPRSSSYDDVYHSTEGGLAQTRHVFLAGNNLPQRWQGRRDFSILETGFGLGLNFLVTWQAWREDPQRCERLHFISTELNPFSRADLEVLHARWPELADLAAQLHAAWPPLTPGFHHILLDDGKVTLTLLLGDANATLKDLLGKVDAIYLDGFAPQRNPQLWSPEILKLLTQHAAAGATLASWCVAGEVRSPLKALGWKLRKPPGFAHKWQMLTGKFDGEAEASPESQTALVIGAGIAGCSMTEALARRGWQITLLERNAEPAQEASGNPAGLLHPMLARDDNLAARFSRAAYLYSLRLLDRLGHAGLPWDACGILQIAEDADDAALQQACSAPFPPDYVSWLTREQATAQAGLPVSHGGWWFPHGAWVNPPALCKTLLQAAGSLLQFRGNSEVAALRHIDGCWHALDAQGNSIASASHLILANAAAANALLPELSLSLRSIRGQLSYLPGAALAGLNTSLCGVGYAIRNGDTAIVGASFVDGDTDTALRAEEHRENLDKLKALLPELQGDFDANSLPGRVSFRAASQDRMPLVGTLPQVQLKEQHTLENLPRQAGLHTLLGFGARGLSWAPLAAELLAAQLNGECLPLEKPLLRMLDPARHHLREIRRNANL